MEYIDLFYNWQDKTILIVEDDENNFLFFKEALRYSKATVLRAKNGFEAIEYCSKEGLQIDLILMDIQIPFINGIDATREIKRYRKHIPIIAETAYSSPHVKKQCFLAGCDEYLVKPFSIQELLKTIEKYFIPTGKTSEVYKGD